MSLPSSSVFGTRVGTAIQREPVGRPSGCRRRRRGRSRTGLPHEGARCRSRRGCWENPFPPAAATVPACHSIASVSRSAVVCCRGSPTHPARSGVPAEWGWRRAGFSVADRFRVRWAQCQRCAAGSREGNTARSTEHHRHHFAYLRGRGPPSRSRDLSSRSRSCPRVSVCRRDPALDQYSFSEFTSKTFGHVWVARHWRRTPSVFPVIGSNITWLAKGNCLSGYQRAMCWRWVLPGWANR